MTSEFEFHAATRMKNCLVVKRLPEDPVYLIPVASDFSCHDRCLTATTIAYCFALRSSLDI